MANRWGRLTDITEEKSPSTTKLVVGVRSEGQTGDTTDGLDSVEDTEEGAGGVAEVLLPIGNGLET